MKLLRTLSAASSLIAFVAMNAQGALEWASKTQSFTAELGSESIIANYAFTNTGSEVVSILDVKTSCGCTVAKPDKKHYKPGEGGTLEARFDIGSRRGRNVKKIVVQTSDRQEPRTDLVLTVDIPTLLRPNRSTVYWHEGREPSTELVSFSAQSEHAVEIVEVSTSHTNLVVEQTVRTPGREFEFHLRPLSTAQALNVKMTVLAKPADRELLRQYTVYTRILPKPRIRR